MAVMEQIAAPFVLPRMSDDVLLAKFFRALGDPTRLEILHAVMDEEKNVTALVDLTGAPQGRVSSHLACLRWCGYVATRKEGRQVFYRVTDRRVAKLLDLASRLVEDNCERIRSCTIIDRRRLQAGAVGGGGDSHGAIRPDHRGRWRGGVLRRPACL